MKLVRIHTNDHIFTLDGYEKCRIGIIKIEACYSGKLLDGSRVYSTTEDYRVTYGQPEGFIVHYKDKIKFIPYSAVTLIEGI